MRQGHVLPDCSINPRLQHSRTMTLLLCGEGAQGWTKPNLAAGFTAQEKGRNPKWTHGKWTAMSTRPGRSRRGGWAPGLRPSPGPGAASGLPSPRGQKQGDTGGGARRLPLRPPHHRWAQGRRQLRPGTCLTHLILQQRRQRLEVVAVHHLLLLLLIKHVLCSVKSLHSARRGSRGFTSAASLRAEAQPSAPAASHSLTRRRAAPGGDPSGAGPGRPPCFNPFPSRRRLARGAPCLSRRPAAAHLSPRLGQRCHGNAARRRLARAASLRRLPPSCGGARPHRGPGRPRESLRAGRESRRVPRAPSSPLTVNCQQEGGGVALGPEERIRRSAGCGCRGPAGVGAGLRLGCALGANGDAAERASVGREAEAATWPGARGTGGMAGELLPSANDFLPSFLEVHLGQLNPPPCLPCASASCCMVTRSPDHWIYWINHSV